MWEFIFMDHYVILISLAHHQEFYLVSPQLLFEVSVP